MNPRGFWGARAPKAIHPRSLAIIRVAHVHYSDGPPPAPDAEAGAVQAIQGFHMGPERDWDDIGYHRLIAPGGTVYEGRHLDWIGAETEGHNTTSVGYCFLTNGPVTPAAWGAFLAQLALDQQTIGRQLEVRPHSADYPTACPGDSIRHLIATGAATTPPPAPQTPVQPPKPGPAGPNHPEEDMPPVLTATDPETGDYWVFTPATGALDAYQVGGAPGPRFYGNFHDHPQWDAQGPIVGLDFWPGSGAGSGYVLYALGADGRVHPFNFDPNTVKRPAA